MRDSASINKKDSVIEEDTDVSCRPTHPCASTYMQTCSYTHEQSQKANSEKVCMILKHPKTYCC